MISAAREPVTGHATDAATGLPAWHAPEANITLATWLDRFAEPVREALVRDGGVLLRAFAPLQRTDLAQIVAHVTGALAPYNERSTPRRHLGAEVYTSTEYPADQEIFLHNENAYASSWPAHLYFYCARAAATGGETTLADVLAVERAIDADVKQHLCERGLLLRRTFVRALGVPWEEAFATRTLDALKVFCAANGYRLRDENPDHLVVDYRHAPLARHPTNGRPTWFNHAAFFQRAALDQRTAHALSSLYPDGGLPNRILYGDGDEIEPAVIDHLRHCYRSAVRTLRWQDADLLIVDNMRHAHGRRPFTGERAIWVAMSGLLYRKDLST